MEKPNNAFCCIVASGLVSGSYYYGGGASDINALKTSKSTCHSFRTSPTTPRACSKSIVCYRSVCERLFI